MKKIILVLFIVFCQGILMGEKIYEVSSKDTGALVYLRLPYESNRILSRVFKEDTVLALEIQEMYVDGKAIFPQPDSILREYIAILKTRWNWRRKTQFFITLEWSKSTSENTKKIIGNDLRGTDGNMTDSYIIYEGGKELLIHYKVIAPFRDMTPDKIIQKDVPEDAYVGEYWAKVDLTEVFASF